jgi:hypothetical protein
VGGWVSTEVRYKWLQGVNERLLYYSTYLEPGRSHFTAVACCLCSSTLLVTGRPLDSSLFIVSFFVYVYISRGDVFI